MKMVKLICPHCGATLSIGDGIDSFYCQFCGGKILLQGQDKNTIDAKVKLKEFEHKERLQNNAYNYQERVQRSRQEYELNKIVSKERVEKSHNKTVLFLILPLVLLLFLFFFFVGKYFRSLRLAHDATIERLCLIEEQIGQAVGEKDYEKALFLANQLYCSDNYSRTDEEAWNEKRENYISLIENAQKKERLADPNTVFVPATSEAMVGKDCSEVVKALNAAGFTNISMQKALETASKKHPENSVEHVLIGGKTTFTTEDYFDKDIPIIIYYYSK